MGEAIGIHFENGRYLLVRRFLGRFVGVIHIFHISDVASNIFWHVYVVADMVVSH